MKLFKVQFGGPKEISATLIAPGDFRAGDEDLPLAVIVENHTDDDLTVNMVKIELERIDKDGVGAESKQEVTATIPARGQAEIKVSLPLSLAAVTEQLPEEIPDWMRTAFESAAKAALSSEDSGDFEISVAVYCEGVKKPARDSHEIKRYGTGEVGFRF